MNNIAVLDADIIAYVAASSKNDENGDWGEGPVDEAAVNLAGIFRRAKDMVQAWQDYAECSSVLLAFSGISKDNFRRKVFSGYKAHRTSEKPEGYDEVVQYLKDSWPHEVQANLEGDDVLGLYSTDSSGRYIAVSADKDILTLPGKVLHLNKKKAPAVVDNSVEEANRYWMTQTLTGDATDGYKGAPGVGTVKAEAALRNIRTLRGMWDKVVSVYGEQLRKPKMKPKFNTNSAYSEALFNARCARILRSGDYDYTSSQVKLWIP